MICVFLNVFIGLLYGISIGLGAEKVIKIDYFDLAERRRFLNNTQNTYIWVTPVGACIYRLKLSKLLR